MQWAVSDLAFAGFNKKYLSGLPLTYNIEFFYEFGTDHYWDTVLLPLAQNNKEKRTFSIHGPCVAVNLADSGDEYYLKAYAQTFTYAQKIKAEFVVVHTNEGYHGEAAAVKELVYQRLTEVISLAQSYGVQVVIENVGLRPCGSLLFDFEEYLALCRQIDDSGIRGCEFPLGHANMPMYVFCVRLAMDYMTTVEGQTWYEDFLAGRASSQEPLEDTLDVYSRMMDEGIIRVEDLSLSSEERLELLRNRQLAMTTAEINTIKALNEEGTDEFAFYPQYGVADNQGWLLSLGYYFGAGKYLEQPENMAKREAVMDILEFISTDEGQNLLVEDNIGMVSTVKGAVIPADKVFDGIRRAVMQGNYVMRPVLGSLIPVLQPELTSYIRGDISKKEIMQHCREVMEGKVKEEVSIGIAAENFDILETAQLKADTMREVLGTDVALMGVSEAGGFDPVQGVLSKLYAGTIGEQDVKRIAQRNDTVPVYCWTAQVKGEKLLEILDYGAYSEKEREAEETEHFHPYAVAGMKVRYERNARRGARIAEAAMVDGSAIEPDKSYSVAYLEGVLEPEQVSEPKRTGRLLTEVLTEKIKAEGCVKPGSVSIYYTFDIKE